MQIQPFKYKFQNRMEKLLILTNMVLIFTATLYSEVLRLYNGKEIGIAHNDYVSNFLGYWMDNGAYYYYNPLPNMNYEETIIEIQNRLHGRHVPIKYVNYDSWFYEKGLYKL